MQGTVIRTLLRSCSCCFIALIIVIAAAGTSSLRAEHVFLKDGRIVSGAIVKDAPQSITVKTTEGKTDTIAREDILRILYTELSMGKIHVQMRDGRNFEAFIVDEDQKSYIFRKVLLSPEEMTVNRSEVLFISERNPSGLKGEPEADRIELAWYPPYNPVKHYLVYFKEQGEQEYREPLKSKGTSLTLKNLKSNTTYVVKTTAVDDAGEESLPSNELTVTTKNIPPEEPGKVTLTKRPSGDGKNPTAILQWEPARDPDGTVKEYRIYKDTKEGPREIGKSGEPFYELPAGMGSWRLYLRAVDDHDDESPDRIVYLYSRLHLRAGAGLGFPYATLGELVEQGTGPTAGIFRTGFLLENLAFGADLGYFYWKSGDSLFSSMHMAPLTAWAGWRFVFLEKYTLMPAAHCGMAFMYSRYRSMGTSGLDPLEERNKSGAEFLAGGSVTLEYAFTPEWFLYLKTDYTAIIEKSGPQPWLGVSLGAGMNL
ncbi:MAG: hypothetical protein EPN93_05350 [Spirochaetes bacterium]|nr:MAG: hypothetical protein EPN93_05350 [Spirochaetota bacterium]